jgi:hypothetical protein
MFMTNEPTQIGMPMRNQSEQIPNFPFVPLRRMKVRRDRWKFPLISMEIRREQQPVFAFRQREEIAEFVACFARAMIDRPEQRQRSSQPRVRMQKMGDRRQILLLHPEHRDAVNGAHLRDGLRKRRLHLLDRRTRVDHTVTSPQLR